MVRTETGSLQYGVEYPADSGQLHYDFALRLPTVADNIQALETHGSGNMLRLNTAMLASCLLKLGDIPAEAIDFALLEGMVDDDFDILAKARDELKKAETAERQLAGLRLAILALGKHGISEQRARELNAVELEAYLDALGRLYGNTQPAQTTSDGTRRIKSQRKKKGQRE